MQKILHIINKLFTGRVGVISVPYFWLILFFLLPFLIVLKISLAEMDIATIKPLLSYEEGFAKLNLKLGNYVALTEDNLYWNTYLRSIKYAVITTFFCLLIGYPFA
ncbi:MAG: putrescine ABC transporter permease PotH, partial [Burkholderiales bacterium]